MSSEEKASRNANPQLLETLLSHSVDHALKSTTMTGGIEDLHPPLIRLKFALGGA